jgi:hypothetical protein
MGVSVLVPREAKRGGSNGATTGLMRRILDGLILSLMRAETKERFVDR